MSIVSEIKKSTSKVFRRMYMKRRMPGGDYESDWQEIPNKYITKWGTIQYSADDVMPDFYKTSAINFEVSNRDGYFSGTDDDKSFFYGALSVYKTFVKIESGYEDASGNEYPTDPTLFVGIIGSEFEKSNDGLIKFKAEHLTKSIEEIPADRLTIPPSNTMTSDDIVALIRDFKDSNDVYILQKYISSGAWNYTTGTDNYTLETSTSLQNLSCWELLKKIANAENKVVYINRIGSLYFKEKSVASGTAAFHFSGIGDSDRTYGHNIMEKITVDENIENVYNRIKIKHNDSDTITSYYIKNEAWNWGDSSSSFMFGVREYEHENVFLNTAGAMTIADTIYNEFCWPKKKIQFTSKFVPHLSLLEYVTITYKKNRYSGDDTWGNFLWGHGKWGKRYGYNIELDNLGCKITELKHNIDKMCTDVTLREV